MAGDRLPSPPRERKPALAALAALLVLVGALGATLLVLRAGERVEAIMITEDIPAGQPITEDAISSVMVADNTDVEYVLWEQRGQLGEFRAETDIVDGSVLVGGMLTTEAGIADGQAVLGVPLQPGQYPPGLEVGDTVTAYLTGDSASEAEEQSGEPAETPLVSGAKVTEINSDDDEADGGSAIYVRLRVDEENAQPLADAASEQAVAIVIVGGSN
jgi:hypothetical protein